MGLWRLALILGLFWAALSLFAQSAPALDRVVLQLRWEHQFQFAGYYAALWQGLYQAEGLEVEIRSAWLPGGQRLIATTEVAEGRAEFGVGGADILVAQDKGARLAVLASIFQQSGARLFALAETNLTSPADLTRLKVVQGFSDLIFLETWAMLKAEGIDPGRINFLPYQPAVKALASRQAEVVPGYSLAEPFLFEQAGLKVIALNPATYGVDFYGDSLFTRQELAAKNPDLVQRFTRASLKGWQEALRHPEPIAERIARELKRTEQVSDPIAFNRFQIEEVRRLCLYPAIEVGHTNPDRWAGMHAQLKAAGLVRGEFKADEFIFDPLRRHELWHQKVDQALRFGLLAFMAAAAGLFFWLWSLRRAVAARTKEILAAKERLEMEVGERRRVEAALSQSEERFRTIADFTHDWETWLGPDGRFIYVSPSCQRITGRDQAEFLTDPELIWKIAHPDDQEKVAHHFRQEIESPKRESLDFRIVTPAGEVRWIGHVCQPVYGRDGAFLGRRGSNRDISERVESLETQNRLVAELKTALSKVKMLSGLIPICASCKKIRNDQGYWQQVEEYIRDHSEAEFSHCLCPDCARKLYPEFYKGE